MLQHMPKAPPRMTEGAPPQDGLMAAIDLLDADEHENWTRANILLDTADDLDLIGPRVGSIDLLRRLFHEESPRVFDAQAITFGCTCSADRVRQSLAIYSARDIDHMTTDQGTVTADCQFCGAHYEFDPKTLGFEAIKDTADDHPNT